MPTEAILNSLQDLRLELDKLAFEHEDHRTQVEKSVAELEEKLRAESFMSGDEYLLHELRDSLADFEEHHPKLTDMIGHISDLLAKMGI